MAGRNDDSVIERLADELKQDRLRSSARVRLGEELARLDRAVWHVEPNVLSNGVTVPYVICGPTGVFALAASHAWSVVDLAVLDRLSRELAAMMPGYPDPVRTGVYLPFDDGAPRSWFDGQGRGGWIIGRGQLPAFLLSFSDQGFTSSDLGALRACLATEPTRSPPLRMPAEPLQG
jgi:hypothetical protein